MEYTIVDMNALKVKMMMILLALGFIYALIYLVLTTLIPYNLTIRKQKDVFFRRVVFFTGIFTLFFAELTYIANFLIAGWRPNMNEDDMSTIVSTLTSFVLPACIISLVIYNHPNLKFSLKYFY